MPLPGAVGNALSNHMQVLWYNWIAILVLDFCFLICAIAGAAGAVSKAYGFVVVWTALEALVYGVGGTLIVRYPKYRSALSVGFLIGVSVCMVLQLLVTGVVSGANFAAFGLGSATSSTQAVTAFASLLLIAITFFTVFLTMYRDTLLPPVAMASTDHSEGLPPASGFGGATAQPYAGGTYPGAAIGDHASFDKPYSTDESVTMPGNTGGVL